MENYQCDEIRAILGQNGLFLPAEIVVSELIRTGMATPARQRAGLLSNKKYSTSVENILIGAATVLKKESVLCVSPKSVCSSKYPRLNEVFQEFIKLSKDEIILVSPFLSNHFLDDMKKIMEPKKAITTIITSDPGQIGGNKKLSMYLINECVKRGYGVKVTKRDLHAKIYLFDDRAGMLGSSNLTRNGFFENYEIGMAVFGSNCVGLRNFINDLQPEDY